MKASDVMSAPVVTIPAEATITEAAKILLDRGISGAPVVNDDGRLAGMLTESDLFRRCEIGTEPDPQQRSQGPLSNPDAARGFVKSHAWQVRDIMTRDVVRVFEETPLAQVAALLELKRIRRVPVMRRGRIVGIISRADLLRALVLAAGNHDR